jgi:protein gp37
MTKHTKIEWADHTFNPWEGCQKVGPGCDHCYAETRNARFGGGTPVNWGPGAPRRRTSAANWRQPINWNTEAERTGTRPRVFCASLADVFDNEVPAQWLADLFDLIRHTPHLDWLLLTKRIGNWEKRLLAVRDFLATKMAGAPKPRSVSDEEADAMNWVGAWMLNNGIDPIPDNVWLGITVVNQAEADRDIPKLLAMPAAKRFLSMEPLLGPVDLGAWIGEESCHVCNTRFFGDGMNLHPGGVKTVDFEKEEETGGSEERKVCPNCGAVDTCGEVDVVNEDELGGGIHWVIVGGESGPGARPMHPDWARSLRDQCRASGCDRQERAPKFLFKQWGEWEVASVENGHHDCDMASNGATWLDHDGTIATPSSSGLSDNAYAMKKVGKKKAGRLLDGREWNEVPACET